MSQTPMWSAYLCLDCETIFSLRFCGECPRCASKAYFPLDRWFNQDKHKPLTFNEDAVEKVLHG